MTTDEMKKEFYALYNMMANSDKVEYMHVFGNVHKEMMEWFIANKSDKAAEWLGKLEAIKWDNYLTQKEAEEIVDSMKPKAPWSYEQWKSAIEQHKFDLEDEPYYNKYALWVTMNMKMSDSSETLKKYVAEDKLFEAVYDLAVDNLVDEDMRYCVRTYFGL